MKGLNWLTAPVNTPVSGSDFSSQDMHKLKNTRHQWHLKLTQTLWQVPEANRLAFHLLIANSCLRTAPCEQMKEGRAAPAPSTGGISEWRTYCREMNKQKGIDGILGVEVESSLCWINGLDLYHQPGVCDERFIPLLHAVKWPRHLWRLSPPISSASHFNKD